VHAKSTKLYVANGLLISLLSMLLLMSMSMSTSIKAVDKNTSTAFILLGSEN